MRTNTINNYFLIAIVALFFIIIAPLLFADGMFMDGTMYASISRNLAQGLGSFWKPYFSATLFSEFHEHPPLVFGLQALGFYSFGNSIYIERIYSLFIFLFSFFTLKQLWTVVTKDSTISFLPLLFWIIVPVVTWSCASNMLENTMTLFVLLSTLYFFNYNISPSKIGYLIVSGLFLMLAFLTKGFVCLFIWSIPFFLFISKQQSSFITCIKHTLFYILAVLLPLGALFLLVPESLECIVSYVQTQVVKSIQSAVTVNSRFFIIGKLIQELLISIALCVVLFAITRIKKRTYLISNDNRHKALLFFCIGLSGVLPIMISQKQSGYYIVSTYPFFAMAMALLMQVYVRDFVGVLKTNTIYFKRFKAVVMFMVVVATIIVALQYKRIGRDVAQVTAVQQCVAAIAPLSTISIDDDMYTDWALHAYFQRYGKISLDVANKNHQFYLTETAQLPPQYNLVLTSGSYTLGKLRH